MDYNPYLFREWIIHYFRNQPCLLCGQVHLVIIFQSVLRKTPCAQPIWVFRIYCAISHKTLTQGIPNQYTTRVLPKFCIPSGRHTADAVASVIDFVADGNEVSEGAAQKIGPSVDLRTLQKYLDRAIERIGIWGPFLVAYLTTRLGVVYQSQHPPGVAGDSFETSWCHFNEIVFQVADRLEELPGEQRPKHVYGYCLAVIGLNEKALGP